MNAYFFMDMFGYFLSFVTQLHILDRELFQSRYWLHIRGWGSQWMFGKIIPSFLYLLSPSNKHIPILWCPSPQNQTISNESFSNAIPIIPSIVLIIQFPWALICLLSFSHLQKANPHQIQTNNRGQIVFCIFPGCDNVPHFHFSDVTQRQGSTARQNQIKRHRPVPHRVWAKDIRGTYGWRWAQLSQCTTKNTG